MEYQLGSKVCKTVQLTGIRVFIIINGRKFLEGWGRRAVKLDPQRNRTPHSGFTPPTAELPPT
jgi:hypothetical protein